jgi:hypothetical protein
MPERTPLDTIDKVLLAMRTGDRRAAWLFAAVVLFLVVVAPLLLRTPAHRNPHRRLVSAPSNDRRRHGRRACLARGSSAHAIRVAPRDRRNYSLQCTEARFFEADRLARSLLVDAEQIDCPHERTTVS